MQTPGTTPDDDPERSRRLDRLVRMLGRIRMRTERELELDRALQESERVGARRERERCAAWLESLDCDDPGITLMLLEVARALRAHGLPDDH